MQALELRNRSSTAALVLVAVGNKSKTGNVVTRHGGHAAEERMLEIGTARRAIARTLESDIAERDAVGQRVSAAIERDNLDPVPAFGAIHVLHQGRGTRKIGIADACRGVDENGRRGSSLGKI